MEQTYEDIFESLFGKQGKKVMYLHKFVTLKPDDLLEIMKEGTEIDKSNVEVD